MKVEIIYGGGEMPPTRKLSKEARCTAAAGESSGLVGAGDRARQSCLLSRHYRPQCYSSGAHRQLLDEFLATENSHCLFYSPNLQLLVPAGFVM
ncbi:unnamed protein product [Sphagnum balticum]